MTDIERNAFLHSIDIENIRELADEAGSTTGVAYLDGDHPGLPPSAPVFVNRKAGTITGIRDIFEKYRTHPERKSGTAQVTTLDSFIDLTNRHKTEHSAIFANSDWRKPSFTTVLDYHSIENGPAAWGRHRVHYEFPLSEEWQAWAAQNNEAMGQAEFAEWIEDHIAELATPTEKEAADYKETFGGSVATPSEIMLLSRGLKIHAETRASSSVVLGSGEGELTFEETHKDAAGNKLTVPGLFILSIAPFFMGEKARIPVRLRYRLRGGAVTWLFVLHRPDVHITTHVNAALDKARDATGLPTWQGAPEMSA